MKTSSGRGGPSCFRPTSKCWTSAKQWLNLEWQQVRDSVQVKLYGHDQELYVLARSDGRQAQEVAIRRKRLARLPRKLRAMRRSPPARDQLLLGIGERRRRKPGARLGL